MAVGNGSVPVVGQWTAVKKRGKHDTYAPEDGSDADDEGEDEESAGGEETVVEEEDGKFGGGNRAAEEDLSG